MRDSEAFTVDDPRFSTGQVVGRSMLTTDGEEHSRQRAPYARPFRLDPVRERFTAVVEEEVERLISGLEPAGRGGLRRGPSGAPAAPALGVGPGVGDGGGGQMLRWYDAIPGAPGGLSPRRAG